MVGYGGEEGEGERNRGREEWREGGEEGWKEREIEWCMSCGERHI